MGFFPGDEEEDLTGTSTDPLTDLSLQGDDYVTSPLPPSEPRTGVGRAPAPSVPQSDADFIREYFRKQSMGKEQLNNAEDTASKNRFIARLGQASATLGNALAGAKMDNTPFEGMVKDADNPVTRLEREQKYTGEQDKGLQTYLARKDLYNTRKEIADKNAEIRQKALDQSADIASGRREDYNKRTDSLNKLGEGRLAIAGQSLGLRKGAQAAQAADKFNKDPLIKATNQQLSQIDKGLSMLDNVDKGKIPFTTTIVADIEKDLANILSGGTSSSLGQLERVEFKPAVAKVQRFIDYLKGYQGDINAPEFKKQLRAQFNILKDEIGGIQGRRSSQINESYGTAYQGNDLAKDTLSKNKLLYGKGAAHLSPEDEAALQWAKQNPNDPRAQKILQLHGM